jgi:transglutaminase-like putative cysteine protease
MYYQPAASERIRYHRLVRPPRGRLDRAAVVVCLAVGATVTGCAAERAGVNVQTEVVEQPARTGAAEHTVSHFSLSWRGRPAGLAREVWSARPGGFRLARWERWRIARAGAPVEWETEIVVDADLALRGQRIALYRDRVLRGSARRTPGGWMVDDARAGAAIRAPARAEPAELVLRRVGRAAWTGPVVLAGLDFAVAELAVGPVRGDARRVVLRGAAGRVEGRVWLRADGGVERAVGPDVVEQRVASLASVGEPPDLIALGSIDVAGALDGAVVIAPAGGAARRIALDGAADWSAPSVPDPPPSPALRALADRVLAGAPRSGLAQLGALARATADLLEDDLAGGAIADPGDVAARGRADCVGHAVLFSALARSRGFEVRLVSGYRLERRRLVRHVWAAARVGGALVAIDPTTGEAPVAPGRHAALAAHGSAPAEIALAAELAFAGLTGARARFAPLSAPRSARSTPRSP